jgi:hypothetical protein
MTPFPDWVGRTFITLGLIAIYIWGLDTILYIAS